MNDQRAAILNGRKAAAELHRDLGVKARIEADGQVDVFEALDCLQIPCLCRPLDGLLGAYLPQPYHGVLVTTERSRAIQRFTAAHELGHAYLGHDASYDDESVVGKTGSNPDRFDSQEVAADAFAGAFMAPQWLIVRHAKRQGWTIADLRLPENVYQLSLRLGLSYRATGVSLVQNDILTWLDYAELREDSVKEIKLRLGGPEALTNWNNDVWRVGMRDASERLRCAADDAVVLSLEAPAVSDCRWLPDSERSLLPLAEQFLAGAVPSQPGGHHEFRFCAPTAGPVAISFRYGCPSKAADVLKNFYAILEIAKREVGYPLASRALLCEQIPTG